MSERNLEDIDFCSIEQEISREDKQREKVRTRLNIFNQPNQQDPAFFEKEHRELEMKHPERGDVLFFIRAGAKPGKTGG
jgi:hypothetical protein